MLRTSYYRSIARQKEVAIRAAMGASRFRLVRQMLTESVLLALFGGLSSLAVSRGGIRLLLALAPQSFPHGQGFTIDGRVLGFTFIIAILTGIGFGLAPALQASRFHLNETLKEGGRTSSSGSRHRTRSILVVVEVALALVLLVSAGLLMNTLFRVLRTDAGFNPDTLFTLEFRMDGAKYIDWNQPFVEVSPQMGVLCQQLLERVSRLPGIESAALIDWLPMVGDWEDYHSRPFSVAGAQFRFRSSGQGLPTTPSVPPISTPWQTSLRQGRRCVGAGLSRPGPGSGYKRRHGPSYLAQSESYRPGHYTRWRGREAARNCGVVGNIKEFALRDQGAPQVYVLYLQRPPHTDGGEESRVHKSLYCARNLI